MQNEPFDLNDYISQRKEKDYEFASGLCIPILWLLVSISAAAW